jgi:uncharacterized membrane protein YoaT (DUF817 family)
MKGDRWSYSALANLDILERPLAAEWFQSLVNEWLIQFAEERGVDLVPTPPRWTAEQFNPRVGLIHFDAVKRQ